MKRRVVITGIGVVAPGGVEKEKFWSTVKNGVPMADLVSQFESDGLPTKIAAEVKGFNPCELLGSRWMKRIERSAQFALGSAILAYQDAHLALDFATARRTGVFEGTAIGSMNSNFALHKRFISNNLRQVSPASLISGMTGNSSGTIAQYFHLNGPAVTFSEGCVSSSYAVGYAFRKIQQGELDLAFAGGAEAPISKEMFVLFSSAGLLSTKNEFAAQACKPFDARRDGFVMGEGGAILILEELNHALDRGAQVYAEIAGFGETTDAYHPLTPEPQGVMIIEAMRKALFEAGIQPEEVDYLNAHGTATYLNDIVETKAVKEVFGECAKELCISSTKATIGHLLGACGAVELVISALAIRDKWVPPTANYQNPDPLCDLDYVPGQGRVVDLKVVMSNNYSFGGRNSSIVLKQFFQ